MSDNNIQLKRGQKLCPNCQSINAARTYNCTKCNYSFKEGKVAQKLEKEKLPQLKKGQKVCPNCKAVNAARQMICKICQHEFASKNIPTKNQILDWKNLQNGDYIKIVQGSGPYYISRRDSIDGKAGDRICMGSVGVFKVVSVTDQGINTYGAMRKNGGYAFLYMGTPYQSEQTGVYIEPYKIRKVKRRE